MGYILRCQQFSIDLYGDVVNILDADRHGVEFFIGDSNRSLSLLCVIGKYYGFENCLTVFELGLECIGIGDGTKFKDIVYTEDGGKEQEEQYALFHFLKGVKL